MRLRSSPSALALVVLGALAGVLALGVPRASAIDPFPNQGIATLSSSHFQVHYDRDDQSPSCAGSITQERAGDVLGMAERAYTLYLGWGYPAAVLDSDGNGLTEISVDDFAAPCVSYGAISPSVPRDSSGGLGRWDALVNPVAPAGAGELHLDAAKGLGYRAIAHEVFHLFQRAVYPTNDQWLEEGTAEWAALRAVGLLNTTGGVGQNDDRTSDCVGSECGDTEFDRNGYPGWLLFAYLAERYGNDAVKEVWNRVATVNNPAIPGTSDLSDVLVVHGTTLPSFFNAYANARLGGNFAAVAGTLPAPGATLAIADTSGAIPTMDVAVNHLAVRYLALQRAANAGPCYAATLALNVTIPAGVSSAPTYYANTKGAVPQVLSISGSTASITVPWNTCTGSPDAFLSLPNGSLGIDGREFVLSGTVTVDRTSPAAASEAPAQLPVYGPVVTAPTSDPAPKLTLHAPELLRVSARDRLLRLVVYASGEGKLEATLGSSSLGTKTLRTGNNDLRFVLPLTVFKSIKSTAGPDVLRLTSKSPQGATGASITRRVDIQAPRKKSKRH